MNFASCIFAPSDWLQGFIGAYLVYPAAEKYLGRDIRTKVKAIEQHYHLPFKVRQHRQRELLVKTLEWAQLEVPYYRDLFKKINFQPARVMDDLKFFSSLPFLTKTILLEQGERMFATRLIGSWAVKNKTGGSTGGSVDIWYDRPALDETAAITRFARTLAGKFPHHRELHFASRFLEQPAKIDQRIGRMKDLAMNRQNIFFSDLDHDELVRIWRVIQKYRPYMVHAHPSTVYALALAVETLPKSGPSFSVFESSGELLDLKKRNKIHQVFGCNVFDRYGLAEMGVVAYQDRRDHLKLRVFDDLVFPETEDGEIVLTALKNRYMPLIRYRTGDLGTLEVGTDAFYFSKMFGRIHDLLKIGEKIIPTHHIQDVLDRIGGITEFQIEKNQSQKFTLKIVCIKPDDEARIREQVQRYFNEDLLVAFVDISELKRVGERQKFRYLVDQGSK